MLKKWHDLSAEEQKEALRNLKPDDFKRMFSQTIEMVVGDLLAEGHLSPEEAEKYIRAARNSDQRERSDIPYVPGGRERKS